MIQLPTHLLAVRIALGVGGALACVLLAWLGAGVLVGDGVPRGTKVMGVDIGGLSEVAAQRTLHQQLDEQVSDPILLTSGEREARLDPARAGLRLDAAATVESATAQPFNPLSFASMLFGGKEVEPVIRTDRSELRSALARVAGKVEQKPRNGDVRFTDAKAVAVRPRMGRGVDVDRAVRLVQGAFPRQSVVELPGRTVRPDVTAAEVRRAMRAFAEPAMSGPLTLDIGTGTLDVSPADVDDHLSMTPDKKSRLAPHLDQRGLRRALDDRLARFETEPRDANVVLGPGGPRVVPARSGQVVPAGDLAKATMSALRSSDRRASVPLERADADLTTAEARELDVDERISSFTTYYPYAAYRLQNIHRAADLIDGTLLLPGETFSLNDVVGERTAANGFAKGTIIQDGRFFEDYGGGVSQVATTTFNAMFFAGLEDVQHKPHSFYIDRYPEGREATVAWPYVDLQFRNDSGNGIIVDTSYTDSSVTVSMWGTKKYEIKSTKSDRYNVRPYKTIYDDSKKCLEQIGVQGFDIKVYRHFYQNGSEVRTETFRTHYNPADEIHCRPKPSKG